MVIQLAEVGDAGFSEVPGDLNASRVETRPISGKTLPLVTTSELRKVLTGSPAAPPDLPAIRSMTRIVDDRDACTSSLHDTAPPKHRAAPTAATTRRVE